MDRGLDSSASPPTCSSVLPRQHMNSPQPLTVWHATFVFTPGYRHGRGLLTWFHLERNSNSLPVTYLSDCAFLQLLVNPLNACFSLHWERSIYFHEPLSLCGSFLPSVILVTKLEDHKVSQIMAWMYSCASSVSSSWLIDLALMKLVES